MYAWMDLFFILNQKRKRGNKKPHEGQTGNIPEDGNGSLTDQPSVGIERAGSTKKLCRTAAVIKRHRRKSAGSLWLPIDKK